MFFVCNEYGLVLSKPATHDFHNFCISNEGDDDDDNGVIDVAPAAQEFGNIYISVDEWEELRNNADIVLVSVSFCSLVAENLCLELLGSVYACN